MFAHITKKGFVIVGLVVMLLLGFFFYSLSGKQQDSAQMTVLPASPLDAKLGRELLSALAELKSTKLDRSIFDDPVFNSLRDFGVEIAPLPVGRRNPFALFAETAGAKGGSLSKPKVPQGQMSKPASAPKAPKTGGFDIE